MKAIPKLFRFERDTDESGISGTGHVADGVQFYNGKCAVSWRTQYSSVAIYDSIEAVEQIHGHDGNTRIVWDEVYDAWAAHLWAGPGRNSEGR